MSNYVPGGQKKDKAFKKCESELLHAISNNYAEEKTYKLAEKLRESKMQAIRVSKSPSNLSIEEVQQKRDLLIRKWKAYSVENILAIYKKPQS